MNWWKLIIAALSEYVKAKEKKPNPAPAPTPKPNPIPAPVDPKPVEPTVAPSAPRVEPPKHLAGGECPVPGGIDVRYDVWSPSKQDYIFYGDLLAKFTVIVRNLDGTFRIGLPVVIQDGYQFVPESYNFPSSASPKIKGNECPRYDKSGTFRFWINCYKV